MSSDEIIHSHLEHLFSYVNQRNLAILHFNFNGNITLNWHSLNFASVLFAKFLSAPFDHTNSF